VLQAWVPPATGRSARDLGVVVVAFPLLGAAFVVVGAVACSRRPRNGTGSLLCVTGLLIIGASAADADQGALVASVQVLLLGEAPIAATLHVLRGCRPAG
jgi:hypothetical protein